MRQRQRWLACCPVTAGSGGTTPGSAGSIDDAGAPGMWAGLRVIILLITGLAGVLSAAAAAKPAIAVLDFELNDLTLMPALPEERERTASIGPLLRDMLESRHGFALKAIDPEAQTEADKAAGYLFDHHDIAAEMGRKARSDWIVVGRVHKASMLFVYFKAKVLDTKTGQLIADLTVEVKGPQRRLTVKGVETLAQQIAAAINGPAP